MPFRNEAEFEAVLINALQHKGWESQVLQYPSEETLLDNWAKILFENNRGIDRLNDAPLTSSEMQQIMEQITALRTPLKLNGFINGKTVSITRDNPADPRHLGKEVSLKIYDRHEIAAGQSRYQIAQQPIFSSRSRMLNQRRGDLMLLINGMPVIHVELKRSGIPVSQAYHQIEKYAYEGAFSGIFSLVQIFVAMEPEETVYFANPGPDGVFNPDFYFHWADFNNKTKNHWNDIATLLLSIPMAHQMIGFYMIPDDTDGVLKVMRSYQYHAANAISDRVAKIKWDQEHQLGGYVWHTTGSGKTMTSFKSAQLIASSKDADKVVFLMDRIELGTQSLQEYRAFAEENEEVQATEDTVMLIAKLKSNNPADTLIVTSIQKMSNIKDEPGGLNNADINLINSKRIVIIVDEAHRSTFGEMLSTIKHTFSNAVFFGFTGTPIHEENQIRGNTTATVFGDELHRYSIADGIRDGNVLGFDPYKVLTYKDVDLRRAVALQEARAASEEEALRDPVRRDRYYHFMNNVGMTGSVDYAGTVVKGIEDYLSSSQYRRPEHQEMVVQDILENWLRLSYASKFHAIFATSSIMEAITYYRLIKAAKPDLKITALFDPNIDNTEGFAYKEDGLVEILSDYNARFGQDFTLSTHAKFKKDVSARLAHKRPYERIDKEAEKQLDLLIVVDQMLTGFDSKWVNTLYLDKRLEYENIIQAFSRTNRLFGPEKPFGTIRYYRFPHTMEQNIEKAVKLYSGDEPLGLVVDRLENNLEKMNQTFSDIRRLFVSAGVPDFTRLPDDVRERAQFAKLFRQFNSYLEAAKIQGFVWSVRRYGFTDPTRHVSMDFNEQDYLILALRYKELFSEGADFNGEAVPFEIDGHLIAIDTGRIDSDYMDSRFERYLKDLNQPNVDSKELENSLNELHQTFASLSQEQQKYANLFLHDLQRGDVRIEEGKPFTEYVTAYQINAKSEQIRGLVAALGVDSARLEDLMNAGLSETNLNEFGRFDDLKATANLGMAREYFEAVEGRHLSTLELNVKTETLLKDFILRGGFDI